MTTTQHPRPATPTDTPDVSLMFNLDRHGRAFMFAHLNVVMGTFGVITADDWREGYGKAADWMTTRAAEEELARAKRADLKAVAS